MNAWLLLIIVGLIGAARATAQPQTSSNHPAVKLSFLPATNAPAPAASANTNRPSLIAAQLASASQAMSAYYQISKDPVDGTVTIEQLDYDHLDDGLGSELVCWLHPPKTYPEQVSLHIHSSSEEWRFLEDHGFTIRADDERKNYGDQKDYSKVVDGGVIENFYVDFSMDELHQYAWAHDVWFKLGYKNCQLAYRDRQKWKLLWKYFDLKKQQENMTVSSTIGGP